LIASAKNQNRFCFLLTVAVIWNEATFSQYTFCS
jgi:hypothetical protein